MDLTQEAVAEKFKDGRWGNALAVFADVINKYIVVEQEFAGKPFDAAVKRVKTSAKTPQACLSPRHCTPPQAELS
jgi:hypothetical protein